MNINKSFFCLIALCLGSINASATTCAIEDTGISRGLRQKYLCEFPDFSGSSCQLSHNSQSSSSGSSEIITSLRECFSGNLQGRRGDLVITVMKSVYNPNQYLVHVINEITGGKGNYLFNTHPEAIDYARSTYAI